MSKKIECLQEGKNDCASACLLSIVRYYDGDLPLETVRNLINTGKNGTNAYDLVEGSKQIGFSSFGKKITLDELKNKRGDYPVIVHIKKESYYHFVVVYKYLQKNNKFLIMDPSVGLIKINYEDLNKVYLNTTIFFSKEKELPNIKMDNQLFKMFYKSLITNKTKIIIISLLSLITFIFTMLEILFFRKFLSLNNLSNSFKLFISFIVIILLKNSFDFIRGKIFIKFKIILNSNINTVIIKRLLSLPYSYFKNKTTGEIISRINDLDLIKDIFLDLTLNLFVNILLIISILTLLFILNIKIFVIILLSMLIYFIIVKIFSNKTFPLMRFLNETRGFYTNNLIETIDGLETINNLNIKMSRMNILENNYNKYNLCYKKLNNILYNESIVKSIFNDILNVLIIVYSVYLAINKRLETSNIVIVYMLFNYLFNALKIIIDKYPDIKISINNLEKINQILIYEEASSKEGLINGPIVIKNLNFKYNTELINNLNLEIKERSKVFLKGKSGSGKSTLLKILLKYYKNYQGIISINGIDLKEIDEYLINNSVTYISQNETLFTNSFKYNLDLGRNISEEELLKVEKICRLESIFKKRKFADDFFIEENGFNLSGGEKQRIILARGLLKKSNYLFIDEALSMVEESLEKDIIKDILNTYKDKTIIYVSHRKSILELFDEIYDLERRNINEQ